MAKNALKKHTNTKHQEQYPVCGKLFWNGPKDLDMMYYLSKHIKAYKIKYSEPYKETFQCKLCTFESSNDQEI